MSYSYCRLIEWDGLKKLTWTHADSLMYRAFGRQIGWKLAQRCVVVIFPRKRAYPSTTVFCGLRLQVVSQSWYVLVIIVRGFRHQPVLLDEAAPFGRVSLFARHAAKVVIAALPSAATLDDIQSEASTMETWEAMLSLQPVEGVEPASSEARQTEISVSLSDVCFVI